MQFLSVMEVWKGKQMALQEPVEDGHWEYKTLEH